MLVWALSRLAESMCVVESLCGRSTQCHTYDTHMCQWFRGKIQSAYREPNARGIAQYLWAGHCTPVICVDIVRHSSSGQPVVHQTSDRVSCRLTSHSWLPDQAFDKASLYIFATIHRVRADMSIHKQRPSFNVNDAQHWGTSGANVKLSRKLCD